MQTPIPSHGLSVSALRSFHSAGFAANGIPIVSNSSIQTATQPCADRVVIVDGASFSTNGGPERCGLWSHLNSFIVLDVDSISEKYAEAAPIGNGWRIPLKSATAGKCATLPQAEPQASNWNLFANMPKIIEETAIIGGLFGARIFVGINGVGGYIASAAANVLSVPSLIYLDRFEQTYGIDLSNGMPDRPAANAIEAERSAVLTADAILTRATFYADHMEVMPLFRRPLHIFSKPSSIPPTLNEIVKDFLSAASPEKE